MTTLADTVHDPPRRRPSTALTSKTTTMKITIPPKIRREAISLIKKIADDINHEGETWVTVVEQLEAEDHRGFQQAKRVSVRMLMIFLDKFGGSQQLEDFCTEKFQSWGIDG